MLVLAFVGLFIAMISREPTPATGIANGAADLFLNVLARVAFAAFVTLLLLVVRSIVRGRDHDSR